MACKITWTPNAIKSYCNNIEYLEQNWTEREIYKFEALTEKKLINISNHPKLGSARNKKYPNIRFTLVHKRVALIYRHKPHKEEIELLVFWNTLQNPRKLKMKIDGI